MKPRTVRTLLLLDAHGWMCGQELVEAGVGYRYHARIGEIREAGYRVERRRCRRHPHEGRMCEYRLLPAEQLSLEEVAG